MNICRVIRLLSERGLVDCALLAVSPGGDNDCGQSMLYPESRQRIAALASEAGVEFIDFNDLEAHIRR